MPAITVKGKTQLIQVYRPYPRHILKDQNRNRDLLSALGHIYQEQCVRACGGSGGGGDVCDCACVRWIGSGGDVCDCAGERWIGRGMMFVRACVRWIGRG